ncbi:MAG: sulfate reduction electron transfer complex DsrMKJOP subunit DsrJ [Nitrospirota bacterium]|nr:sulfate reduction electron transfer complex DsrMKJOP subunit DsrJ [Nitrospirota bacterium]
MYNGGKIIIGLIIFLAVATFPFYSNLGKTVASPSELSAGPDEMHLGNIPLVKMRAEHMMLLDSWRDQVVRGGERYIEYDGDQYEKSIQNGCLGCHSKQEFCTKCHDFAGVKPYCWNCHLGEDEEGS